MSMPLRRSLPFAIIVIAGLAAASCGQVEQAATAPTPVPSRSAPPSGSPEPAPTSPAPTPATAGRIQIAINPNPVPFSGQPITDVASCRDRPNTWFYEQALTEVGGVAVTITERVDSFDGAVVTRSNPGLRIGANGSTTIRTRWCSSSPSAHTAQTTFSGTDANGNTWTMTGPVVRLQAR